MKHSSNTTRRTLIMSVVLFLACALAAQGSDSVTNTVANPPAAISVTYIANEGFLVENGGKKVLMDALFDSGYGLFLTPPSDVLRQLTEARGPFADVDLLLITHQHDDHFNPKLVIAHMRNNPRCRLIAHQQVVDRLRKEEGFAQIQDRVHEINLDFGAHEHVTVNGIAVDILCLAHMPRIQNGKDIYEGIRNLAFMVELGGIRFCHLGDATVEDNLAFLNAYPFDAAPVDVLFLGYFNQSPAAQEFVKRKIKPGQIIVMHVPPAELAEQSGKIREAYPHAFVFERSMEQLSFPIGASRSRN